MKILLDPGHGENTPGKRSPRWGDGAQLFEWEFNRQIVRMVARGLQREGMETEIIVPETIDIPLAERADRVNRIARREGKERCLLVSVHANAGGGTGWEAWTSIGQTSSDDYAEIFYRTAHRMLQPLGFPIRADRVDGDSDKESQFYILRKTLCPAVLTENLFMDRERDCRFLLSKEGKRTIAELHIRALLKCCGR
mgnify:CR=1 FL=1